MNSLIWKRRFASLYPMPVRDFRKIILLYHAVGDTPWALPSWMFAQQMQWLKTYCEVLSLDALLQLKGNPEKIQVAITFDDGYTCLYREAAPILAHYQLPAFVYLNTGWILSSITDHKNSDSALGHYPEEKFLNWNEVLQLQKQGWDFGSHGVNHFDLTQELSSVVQNELIHSKQMLEKYLNKPCRHFAYTWGRHNILTRQAVENVGYCYAAAAHHAPLRAQHDVFALPRMNIAKEYSLADFQHLVLGKWDYLAHIHRMKKMLRLL